MPKFVKLTRVEAQGRGSIWINLDQVFSIFPTKSGMGTIIKHGKNGEAIEVLETPEDILNQGDPWDNVR